MRPWLLFPALLLTLPALAEWPEADALGVQVRLNLPGGALSEATGNRLPGVGVSLMAELHFESQFCGRLLMGADDWPQIGTGSRRVRSYQLGGEAVYFLQDPGEASFAGPYLVAGAAGTAWTIGADARKAKVPLRVMHVAFTAGFGYRLTRHLDLEVKLLAGVVDPDFTANAIQFGATYRF